MRPPINPPARGGSLSTVISRYESGALGLPAHGCYFTITQSQFERWACPRKGWFSEIEGLRSRATPEMHLGTAWDAWKREVWTWWMEHDRPYPESGLDRCVWCDGEGCERCGGTGAPGLSVALEDLQAALEDSYADVERVCDTVRRMAEGWVSYFEGGRLQDLQVVGVQVPLARQILNPRTGEPYRPVVYLTDAPPVLEQAPLGFTVQSARWRLSRTGEQGYAVRWPWFQVGALDVLMRHRRTSMGYAVDDKASANPSKYEDGIRIDPQLPGYCWLLEPHLEAFGLAGVAGFFYEAASTRYQRDPDQLEPKWPAMDELRAMARDAGIRVSGRSKEDYVIALGLPEPPRELSRAAQAFTPSWRYQNALDAAGLAVAPYEDHLEHLRAEVDSLCYLRGYDGLAALPYSPQVGARYARELFARVQLLADKRRAAALSTTVDNLDIEFPRVPICKQGVRCAFIEVCPIQAGDAENIRSAFDHAEVQVWSTAATRSDGGVNECIQHAPGTDRGQTEEDQYSGPCAGGF